MSFSSQFEQLLAEHERTIPEQGVIIDGEVLHVGERGVFVDIGAKHDVIFATDELELLEDEDVEYGDTLPIYIEGYATGEDLLAGSLEKGLAAADWIEAERYLAQDVTTDVIITGYNRGGLKATFGRIEGFIPNSHIPQLKFAKNRQSVKAKMIDQRVATKVLEVAQERDRLVLSIKAVQKEQQVRYLESLAVEQTMSGRVVNITKFGAFVDIGHGATGLVHISQLTHNHITHPSECVAAGDEIKVKILDIDHKRKRIGLSRKALLPNPWEQFMQTHQPNQRVAVTIQQTKPFGAFAQITPTVDGLIHISEYPLWSADDPHTLRQGDVVLAAIKSIDTEKQQVALSLRAVTYEEETEWLRQGRSAKNA